MARGSGVHVGARAGSKPSPGEKATITAACVRFIADVLTPRYLPEIRPTENYNNPGALHGNWHGAGISLCFGARRPPTRAHTIGHEE